MPLQTGESFLFTLAPCGQQEQVLKEPPPPKILESTQREARKRGRGVRGNQTSLRSLVLSLVAWSFEFILDICRPPLPPTLTPPPNIDGGCQKECPYRQERAFSLASCGQQEQVLKEPPPPKILESTHTPQPTQTPTLHSIRIIMGLCSDDFRVLSSLPLRPAQPTPCVRFT